MPATARVGEGVSARACVDYSLPAITSCLGIFVLGSHASPRLPSDKIMVSD